MGPSSSSTLVLDRKLFQENLAQQDTAVRQQLAVIAQARAAAPPAVAPAAPPAVDPAEVGVVEQPRNGETTTILGNSAQPSSRAGSSCSRPSQCDGGTRLWRDCTRRASHCNDFRAVSLDLLQTTTRETKQWRHVEGAVPKQQILRLMSRFCAFLEHQQRPPWGSGKR